MINPTRARIARAWYARAWQTVNGERPKYSTFELAYSKAILASFIVEMLTGYEVPYPDLLRLIEEHQGESVFG